MKRLDDTKAFLKNSACTRLRSLSESCADSYGFSLSNNGESTTALDDWMEEEEELEIDDGDGSHKVKKTVRFSETVHRQLFRSNSSILGQRLKNQRKQRKKKKSNNQKTAGSDGQSSATIDMSSSTESDSALSSTHLSNAMEMVTLNCDSGIEVDSEEPGADGSLVSHQATSNREQLSRKKNKKHKRGKNNEHSTKRRVSESDLIFEIDL